jgi:hypothetical protein
MHKWRESHMHILIIMKVCMQIKQNVYRNISIRINMYILVWVFTCIYKYSNHNKYIWYRTGFSILQLKMIFLMIVLVLNWFPKGFFQTLSFNEFQCWKIVFYIIIYFHTNRWMYMHEYMYIPRAVSPKNAIAM